MDEIDRKRRDELLSGVGTGDRSYRVIVFLRQCLITQRMRLGRYEVIPGPRLSVLSELEAIQSFLRTITAAPPDVPAELIEQARLGQPVSVVHFQVVRAGSLEEANNVAREETELLTSLLSVHRGDAGSPFGSLIVEQRVGTIYYSLDMPHYRGNVLGGWLSGEDPRLIAAHMRSLRSSAICRLYVGLFHEALAERNPEFQYFRLWSVLEIVARHRAYGGRPKRDWTGAIQTNAKGQDRSIKEDAQDLVFELLRETLSPAMHEDCFASQLKQGLLSQQIRIWYRRRNCIAHGGPCLCRDGAGTSVGTPQYSNCKAARDEAAGGFDGYLMALREVAKFVLEAELAAATRLGTGIEPETPAES